jgi:hypothetical protein
MHDGATATQWFAANNYVGGSKMSDEIVAIA